MKKILSAVITLMLLGSVSTQAFASSFAKHHPRRAQVLRRDNHLNNQLRADKGHLGGNYGKLAREQRAIRHQERRDARTNGGFITKGQQRQLNREENRLHNQINKDNH